MTRETLDFHETVRVEDILAWAAEYGYQVKFSKGVEENSLPIQIIVFGEYHHREVLISAQIDLINRVRPPMLLLEVLQHGIYDPTTNTIEYPFGKGTIMTTELDPDSHLRIFKKAQQLNIPAIGCDLSPGQLAQATKELPAKLINVLDAIYYSTEHDIVVEKAPDGKTESIKRDLHVKLATEPKAMQLRDDHIVRKMLESAAQSSKPIIAIIGAEHLQNISLNGLLENRGVGIAFIDQTKKE